MITQPCFNPTVDNHFKFINFGKNFYPEFKGYITELNKGVFISAIESKEIGKGHFSALIKQFKLRYDWIRIPTPSKMMIKIAIHLGFEYKEEWFGEPFNEWGNIMLWEKHG